MPRTGCAPRRAAGCRGRWRTSVRTRAWRGTVLYCTVLYCTVLYCTVPGVVLLPELAAEPGELQRVLGLGGEAGGHQGRGDEEELHGY